MSRTRYLPPKVASVRSRRLVSMALGLVVVGILVLSLPGNVAATRTITYPFIAGSFVIPMDAQQTDLLHAFGLVHSILRKGVPVYRVLSPPAVLLKVDPLAPKVAFDGGPFLVWPSFSPEFLASAAQFPGVAYTRLGELQILDHVLPIKRPTNVLILKSGVDWGRTDLLLDQLGIPYDLRSISDVVADPRILFDYALVVDDCPGWNGAYPGDAVAAAFRIFVGAGGHAVFTDIAVKDMEVLFPGHVTLFGAQRGTHNASVHTFGDAPSQYFGPSTISVYTEIDGIVMGLPVSEGVNVLIDLPNYPWGYRVAYRVLAADFGYGNGTVEGFAYHPFEQTGAGHTFSSALYGNTFVSAVPFLPPAPPPAPIALGLPTPPPTPPVPPPPPPPPSLPVVNLAYAGYLFSGFTGLGLADVLRNRLRLRAREKIAVRV